jgi:4-amino-4-deoxy-L-arabinose transferase-like glycosyltransferase
MTDDVAAAPSARETSAPRGGSMQRAADFVDQHPWRAFSSFAGIHIVVWTLAPWFLFPNLPLDLIEALIYGREWQLGYDKLPPLPWYIVEILYRLFHADIAYYLFAQLTVVAAFAFVFRLALTLTGARAALAAVLIVDGLHYFTSTSPKFNHDVIQLPFWALAGLSFYYALRTQRLKHWVLLGIALGGAFWAKYFVAMLAVPLALFVLIDRDARPSLRTAGPYIAAAIALIIAAPHLVWLVQNDFLPLHYVEARATPPRGWYDYVWRPLQFALGQLGWLLPSLVIAATMFFPRRPSTTFNADRFSRRIVTLLTFGPCALLLLTSAITGGKVIGMWGYPLWLFLGLWLVLRIGPIADPKRFVRLSAAWAAATAIYVIAFVVYMAVEPRTRLTYRAELFPGPAVAHELAARFAKETGQPVAYVIAPMYFGGNVSHYAREAPRTVIDGDLGRVPWIDPADLKRRGALVMWVESDPNRVPDAYRALAPDAVPRQPLQFPAIWGKWVHTIGWAIVPPRP